MINSGFSITQYPFYKDFFLIPCEKFSAWNAQLFFGLALSISAVPVIFKILIENKILNSSTGTIIISSAVLIDVICWILLGFALQKDGLLNTTLKSFLCLLFLISLFKGKKIIWKGLENLQIKKWNNEIILSFCLSIVFGLSALFEALGLHSTLGAFLAGVIINSYLKDSEIKESLQSFILSFFSPIFFLSIGFKLKFLENIDFQLVSMVFCLSVTTKTLGSFLGAYLSNLKGKDVLIIGFALNARGLIEIVISTAALEVGLIQPPLYVSLIFMAIFTSILSGAAIRLVTTYKTFVLQKAKRRAAL